MRYSQLLEEKKEGQQDFQEVVVQETDPFDRAAMSDEDESPSKSITPLAFDRNNPLFASEIDKSR